jgi:hypothetical protein
VGIPLSALIPAPVRMKTLSVDEIMGIGGVYAVLSWIDHPVLSAATTLVQRL